MGPSIMLSGILAFSLLVASGYASRPQGLPQATPQTCDTCLFSFRVLGDVLQDPQVVAGVVSFVEKEVCPVVGGGDKCENLAEGLLPVVLDWLHSPATAYQFCNSVGACNDPSVQQRLIKQQAKELQTVGDGAQCMLCELVVSQAQQILNTTVVLDKLNTTAQQVCGSLPADFAKVCTDFVNKYEPLITALIANASSEELCELLGVCSKQLVARLGAVRLPQPTLTPLIRLDDFGAAHLMQRVQTARLSAAPGLPRGMLGDSCDMCKMAVIEAHALITNPAVQSSITNYTEALCEGFPTFQDTCKLYVDTYAPLVFSVLQQYLVADTVCVEIGVCQATVADIVNEMLASAMTQLKAALGAHSSASHMVTQELAGAAARGWAAQQSASKKQ